MRIPKPAAALISMAIMTYGALDLAAAHSGVPRWLPVAIIAAGAWLFIMTMVALRMTARDRRRDEARDRDRLLGIPRQYRSGRNGGSR
jgi:hypothetical protein